MLHPSIIGVMRTFLPEILETWLASEAQDLRTVTTRTGGAYSSRIEPYRGANSWIALRRHPAFASACEVLDEAIRESQVALAGPLYTPLGTWHQVSAEQWLTGWLLCAEDRMAAGIQLDRACQGVIEELQAILRQGSVRISPVTLLGSLNLPDTWPEIPLGPATLRHVSDAEFEILSRKNLPHGLGPDLVDRFVSACIAHSISVPVTFGTEDALSQDDHPSETIQQEVQSVLRALHAIGEGAVDSVATALSLHPLPVPVAYGMSFSSAGARTAGPMTLSLADVSALAEAHRLIEAAPKAEIRVAADRLVDSCGRWSPSDALIDAVVGLEVLLNPADEAERAYRIALNYAVLGQPRERLERYNAVRAAMRMRNKVVHAAFGARRADRSIVQDQAYAARICLRNAIMALAKDNEYLTAPSNRVDIWTARLLQNPTSDGPDS